VAAAGTPPLDLLAWNRRLNATHAMSGLRERGGALVRAIEERRRLLVGGLVRALGPRRVLDLGCEDGWIAAGYADAVEELVLADLDESMLERSLVPDRPGVRRIVADATVPEPLCEALGEGWAQAIVLSALLEHLPDPASALRGLSPLLAPGGRFVVYVPADGAILLAKGVLRAARLGGLVPGLSLDPAPGHLHRFDRRRLVRLLATVGRVEHLRFDPVCLGWLAAARR
jgi:SAM-dependent methyltransferase